MIFFRKKKQSALELTWHLDWRYDELLKKIKWLKEQQDRYSDEKDKSMFFGCIKEVEDAIWSHEILMNNVGCALYALGYKEYYEKYRNIYLNAYHKCSKE